MILGSRFDLLLCSGGDSRIDVSAADLLPLVFFAALVFAVARAVVSLTSGAAVRAHCLNYWSPESAGLFSWVFVLILR